MTTTVSGSSITFNDNTTQNTSAYGGGFAFRNRIINGGMVIDQRNAGASVTPNNSYTLDRWVVYNSQTSKLTVQQNAGSVTPPNGFKNYLGITSSSAYSVSSSDYFLLRQPIEGFNTSDLGWGTASASTVTLSFFVRSSLTGTFGGSLQNSDFTRSYPFTYTISSANTWEQKTVTIAGDTSGTWVGATNGIGIQINFGLGVGSTYSGTASAWAGANYVSATGATSVVGTNGATWYITGVQLEKGSTATSFDYRPYGQELALCQRYYYRFNPTSGNSNTLGSGFVNSSTEAQIIHFFPVSMRTSPTALEQSGTAGNYAIRYTGAVATCSAVPAFGDANTNTASLQLTAASGLTGGQALLGRAVNTSAWLAWSAEL
jgi:hypothetical protein